MVVTFITQVGGSMCYEEYINQNLWAQVEEVSIDNITKLDRELTQMGISVDPNDLEIMAELACYYTTIADTNRAEQLLEKLITKSPENVETYFRIGEAYELLGNRQQALNWIKKAIENGYSKAIIEAFPGLEQLRQDRNYPYTK